MADLIDGQSHNQQANSSAYYCNIPALLPLRLGAEPERTGEGAMIRVLLVDDQQAVRRGLALRLVLEPDIQIVGEAGTGREALEFAQALSPDVVLMDVEMPEMDGIETAATLQAADSRSAVVMLSIHDDPLTRGRARAAGAVAFVEKGGTTEDLLSAIRQAARHSGESLD